MAPVPGVIRRSARHGLVATLAALMICGGVGRRATRALAIRPLRDAGAHRRARAAMAGLLDGWRAGDLAGERRDRRNGVLPRLAVGQRGLGGQRRASEVGLRAPADRGPRWLRVG